MVKEKGIRFKNPLLSNNPDSSIDILPYLILQL